MSPAPDRETTPCLDKIMAHSGAAGKRAEAVLPQIPEGGFPCRIIAACLLLTALTLAAYWPVRDHDFVNYDDYRYVLENRHVCAGLTLEGVLWAFRNLDAGLWHPLTWLSHMLDCELY
ncbi:MAG: hypothetical protein JW821_08855, partial [Deltaproteobacteria bacterium]|nr:hypothetical protein [Deltaproteobacteria bacterium]